MRNDFYVNKTECEEREKKYNDSEMSVTESRWYNKYRKYEALYFSEKKTRRNKTHSLESVLCWAKYNQINKGDNDSNYETSDLTAFVLLFPFHKFIGLIWKVYEGKEIKYLRLSDDLTFAKFIATDEHFQEKSIECPAMAERQQNWIEKSEP